MKPILKNFSGSGVFEYQIRPEIKPGVVELNLYVRTPFVKEYIHHDTVVGLFEAKSNESAKGLRTALDKAETKWGLKLMKTDLQVA